MKSHWDLIGKEKRHGIALPLSALKSEKSPHCGTLLDLIPFIDLAKEMGFSIIQLLPLNDTGYDPSPYNAISSCAIDPRYISLFDLDIPSFSDDKGEKLKLLYDAIGTASTSFSLPWLDPYAAFCSLKRKNQGKPWDQWTDLEPSTPECNFYKRLQEIAFDQMARVKSHAERQGVYLMGDMPILLSPDSADVWENPHLFDRTLEAGAPPDVYNAAGQHWGFPLLHFDKDVEPFLRRRLKTFEKLYHLYRIDHIVGLFRIWAMPKGELPHRGHFIPDNPAVWEERGRKNLQMLLDLSSMLPVGEDLGTIPDMVYRVEKELQIPGTKVIRWERNWHGDEEFIPFSAYEPCSLSTVSTHDAETLSEWWHNKPNEALYYCRMKKWHYHPVLDDVKRQEMLRDSHSTASYLHINLLPEYLALNPLYRTPNDRINIPGVLRHENFRYRMLPTIEELSSNTPFLKTIYQTVHG